MAKEEFKRDFLVDATLSLAKGKQYLIPPFSTKGSEVEWLEECSVTAEQIDAKKVELENEYIAQEYARNRQSEYPTIEDLTIALYDTDDKAALETKRAAVKTKWPKDNSGPVK